MTKEDKMIRNIMSTGKAGRRDLRIFIYAVEIMGRLLFEEEIRIEKIQVTKSVYPEAGKRCEKSAGTASRQIERLGVCCFQEMNREQRIKYFGEGAVCPAPKEIIFHLAYYSRFGRSYEEMLKEEMEKTCSRTGRE